MRYTVSIHIYLHNIKKIIFLLVKDKIQEKGKDFKAYPILFLQKKSRSNKDKMNPYRCTTPSLTALLYIIAVFSISGSSIFTNADSPFDWEPSVSLTADLDEPQQWGFCIDIRGWRGNCDELQARSCKTSGDDTQFEYDLSTKALRAVNYSFNCNYSPSTPSNNRACVKVSDDFDAMVDGVGFALGQCDGSERQTFELVEVDSSNSSFELHAGTGLCLSVSDTSMIPGPGAPALAVMRFLTLSDCDSVPAELKAWTIRPNPLESDQSPTSSPSPTIDPTSSTTIVNPLPIIIMIMQFMMCIPGGQ